MIADHETQIPASGACSRLTPQQRQLVHDNAGLVSVHLNRCLPRGPGNSRDPRWDDLFQEGCLGLIQAALAFDADRGISFVPFALLRIKQAIAVALRSADVECPRIGGRRVDRLIDHRRHDPLGPDRPTLGTRLRGKLKRAESFVRERIVKEPDRRGDRHRLVQMVAAERVLVPDDEFRTSLRQVARRMKSSFARVSACEKQWIGGLREVLEADPEVAVLRRRIRRCPLGVDTPAGKRLERILARVSATEFVRRFRASDAAQRAGQLQGFLEVSKSDIGPWLMRQFARLPRTAREHLLRTQMSVTSGGRTSGSTEGNARGRQEK